MSEETKKRLDESLANRNHADERVRTQAWGFLLALMDHFSSLAPSDLKREPPKDLDPGRLMKQRRLAIQWLAKDARL